ncbi:procathepsin L-like [Chiloscyllium plagiosum]|uniref:procathepsin L-like n=1 Tax=Chiloscyllium plagiosum TaxID=36176 RepID=UPI001CB7D580|nr:procathepsin L-like [Chiloscyllium plagiosum]
MYKCPWVWWNCTRGMTPRLSIMKFALFLGCVVLSTLAVASGNILNSTLDEDWKNWKSEYEKQYTEDEESYRRMIWDDNMRYIKQHNLEYSMGKHTFTVGMNQFGDLTNKEFNELMNGFRQDEADNSTEEEVDGEDDIEDDEEFEESDEDLKKANVDWRTKGWVTPVKNQGRCGSCWAFSATGAIEGQWAKKHGRLVSLSEQNLVDCDKRSHGCNGGWMSSAFQYVIENRGINSARTYPYEAKRRSCRFRRNDIAAKIRRHRRIGKSERTLARRVKRVGPLAVAINAGRRSFRLYRSGVYYDRRCNGRLNHAVLLVGFGRLRGKKYWLVKNSWGTSWGDKGYIKMAKDRRNNCGIANYVVYPIV